MLEILQSLSRAILALLSGAMLIFGFFFFSDGASGMDPSGYGMVWTGIRNMLNNQDSLYIFVPITAVTAYFLGIVNFTLSSLLFNRLWKDTEDDLALVSQVEALQKPQLLKETLDLLHIKRSLVASFFPLIIFGLGLVCDRYEWEQSPWVRIAAGTCLSLIGVLSPFIAGWLTRLLQKIIKKLAEESPNNSFNRSA